MSARASLDEGRAVVKSVVSRVSLDVLHKSAPYTSSSSSSSSSSTFSVSSSSSSSPKPKPKLNSQPKQKQSQRPNAKAKPKRLQNVVKRRVVVPIAVFDRPMTTHIEFLVDPRYSGLRVIGSGSFGVVASARDGVTGQRVAVKKILSAFASSKSARHVLREVRLLRHLQHPNVVSLLDVDTPASFRGWDDVYIVTPLLRTDLRSALNDRLITTPAVKKKIAYQILRSLGHMHAQGVMHRDVKSRNILLSDDLDNVQLCDLGHARFYGHTRRRRRAFESTGNADAVGTAMSKSASTVTLVEEGMEEEDEYNDSSDDETRLRNASDRKAEREVAQLTSEVTTMIQSAPEIGLGVHYDEKVDVWAAGCVIGEVINPAVTLFDSTGRRSHLAEILDVIGEPSTDDVHNLPEHAQRYLCAAKRGKQRERNGSKIGERLARAGNAEVDELAVDLISSMLQFSPAKRPSMKRAMMHRWFDDVRDEMEGAEDVASQTKKSKDKNEIHKYNFAESEPAGKTTKSELKRLVWEEVVAFHPELDR